MGSGPSQPSSEPAHSVVGAAGNTELEESQQADNSLRLKGTRYIRDAREQTDQADRVLGSRQTTPPW
jgi:hypothetical protein